MALMPAGAATITIPKVELLRTGKWAASTGPIDVTRERIESMVAAEADPEIDDGPLKLGHTGLLSTLGDSEPALGWARNLELVDNADGTSSLLGDLADIPAGLEDAVKKGFPRRSAEIAFNVTTPSGKTYPAVLDGLALLGVQPPAVKGLADIEKLYTPAKLAAAGCQAESRTLLSFYGEPTKQERIDDALIWAKQAAAQLGALVGLEHLPAVFAALDAMAPADSRGLMSAAPHHDPVTTATTPGGTMPKMFSPEELAKARTVLGLDDKTTDDQVVAKLSELSELVTEQKAPEGDGGTTTPPAGDGTGEGAPAPAAAGASLSAAAIGELTKAGLAVVPADALQQVQAQAAQGAEARALLAAQQRDALLDEAQRAGKLGAGETATAVRAQLSARLDADFEGTKALIDVMPAIVPVTEIGSDSTGPSPAHLAAGADDAAWDAWEQQVFGIAPTEKKGA